MAIKKIPCGGFYYDDNTLSFVKDKNGRPIIKARTAIPIKVADYLYYIEYDNYDYQDGYDYYDKYKYMGACSAVSKGDLVGRNLDWNYTDGSEFVVVTKATNGRYGTIGVAHTLITEEMINSGNYNERLDVLPFVTNDCMNTYGVYANMNVVNAGDKGYTLGTNKGKQDLCQLMIPRFVCDYAKTAKEAIELLKNMNIYAPLVSMGDECHILLRDTTDVYIIEFVENEMVVLSSTDEDYDPIPNDMNIMCNFYVTDWNGTVASKTLGNTDAQIEATGLTAHSMGLERYNILSAAYDDIDSVTDMASAMESVKFTLAYNADQNPYWYSEFVDGDLTIYSEEADFQEIKTAAIEAYNRHIRDGKTWYTTHTAVYDLENKTVTVYVDEDYDNKYEFKLHILGVI